MFPVEIQDIPEMNLHGLLHVGPYNQIAPTFERLGLVLSQNGLMDKAILWAGVYHDDAGTTPSRDLRSHACCAFPDDVNVPKEMEPVVLPATRAAVLSFRGDYARLHEAWRWFYEEWIPQSGSRPSGQACSEIYRTMTPAVPVEEQLTELVLPIA